MKDLTPEEKDRAKRLYDDGHSLLEIAAAIKKRRDSNDILCLAYFVDNELESHAQTWEEGN